jgi:hypothetical protein
MKYIDKLFICNTFVFKKIKYFEMWIIIFWEPYISYKMINVTFHYNLTFKLLQNE